MLLLRAIIDLDYYRLAIEEESSVVDGTLDKLIRDGKISAEVGTSLMNDHTYARNALWQLTDIARSLFGSRDAAEMEAEELVSLDQEDLEAASAGE